MAKPDLREALLRAEPEPEREKKKDGDGEDILQKNNKNNPHYRPSRARKSNVTGYVHKAVKRQLRTLAAEQDTTIQDLLEEALNDLFVKHGLPDIARLEGDN